MSGFQSGTKPPVDYQLIETNCCMRLRSILAEELSGKKCLIMQNEFFGIFDRISAGLTKKPSEQMSMWEVTSVARLGTDLPDVKPDQNYVVYFMAPSSKNLQLLASHMKNERPSLSNTSAKFIVIFYPHKLAFCDYFIEQAGLWDEVALYDLGSSFVPVDKDIWSYEAPFIYENLFLEGDLSWIGVLAKAILILQNQDVYGKFSRICGIGKYSYMVSDCLKQMQEARGLSVKASTVSDIHTVVLIDRDVDYVTPLLTPLTYEAALDEMFGLKCGMMKIPQPSINGEEQKPKIMMFNSVQPYVDEIRNQHISVTLKHLVGIGNRLSQGEKEVSEIATVSKLKNFVDKLPDHLKEKSFITSHFEILSKIIEDRGTRQLAEQLHIEHSLVKMFNTSECLGAIEDILANGVGNDLPDWSLCLRLACLAALTCDGLSSGDYNRFTSAFYATFGPRVLLTLKRLEQAGLFFESGAPLRQLVAAASKSGSSSSSWSFKTAAKRLPLAPPPDFTMPEGDNPSEPSYIYNGAYIPLSVRLVEYFLSLAPGLPPSDDMSSYLRYKPFLHDISVSTRGTAGQQAPVSWPRSALVCFVGGATYAEVAALRLLGKRKGCQIIIATTAMLNGKSFMTQFT